MARPNFLRIALVIAPILLATLWGTALLPVSGDGGADGFFGDDSANINAEDQNSGSSDDSEVGETDGSEVGPGNCKDASGPGVACLDDLEHDDPSIPTVNLSDLVSFRPANPVQGMQPNGWAVVGLPANFVSAVDSETQSGVLLGLPVRIRFAPDSWEWDFGDGEQRTASTGGASWAALRVPEFSETATSHVFRDRGEFTVNLTVRFTAEYQFAGHPWRTIAGTLPVAAGPLTIVSATAKTVLVEKNCIQNPAGPGC